MGTLVSLDEAGDRLPDLVHQLAPTDEVVITEDGVPVARLIRVRAPGARRTLGSMKGSILHIAPDFDAPLEDFREYTAAAENASGGESNAPVDDVDGTMAHEEEPAGNADCTSQGRPGASP
ncbi:MAG: hypothetical protein HY719_06055 [Planctomycetes bacterium]|nr:hypothetical protein [Planctomycetota bacterium]